MKHCLLSLLCWGAFCLAAPADDLADRLNNLTSLRADFNQVITDGHHQIIYQSTGKMALARPGKFRWETKSPTPQIVIATGKVIWLYDAELGQATRQSQTSEDARSPAMLLSQPNKALLDNFNITQLDADDFQLVPRHGPSYFKTVELKFKGTQLSSMKMQDKLDQTTEITFSHAILNPKLSDEIFEAKFPLGTEIIDNK